MKISSVLFWIDRLAYFSLLGLIISLPFSPALAEIFSIALISSWLLTQFSGEYRQFWKLLPVPIWFLLLGLVIWGLAISPFCKFPAESFIGCFAKWGEWIALCVAACATISSAKRLENFFKTAILSSLLILFDGFWQYFSGFDFLRHRDLLHGFYPRAGFSHYTHFASYVMIFFLLGVGLNLTRGLSKTARCVLTVHNALCFLMLVLTFCRGAWLSGLAAFLIFTYIREKKLFFAATVALGLIFLLTPADLIFRFGNVFTDEGSGYRGEIWMATLRMIQDHFWTGVGINNFHREFSPAYFWEPAYAHNSWIQFAAEAGVPGFLFLFGWFFSVMSWAFLRLRKTAGRYTEAGFVLIFSIGAFLAHSFVDNLMFNINLAPMPWIFLGVLISLVNLNKNPSASAREVEIEKTRVLQCQK